MSSFVPSKGGGLTAGRARAILSWYADAGVDEAIANAPVNRLRPQRTATQTPQVSGQANARASAGHDPDRTEVEKGPRKTSVPAGPAAGEEGAEMAAEIAAACNSLSELEEAVRGFDSCNLKRTAMNTVFADGVAGAPVMMVGEAPGADEDRQGKPFVGASGQLLDRMLQWAGFSRQRNVYISNILPWRPPGNRKPTPAETLMCLPFIQRHIELARPKVLVLLGGTAAATLLGTTQGITRIRGRWMKLTISESEYSTLPTYHPAYLLRQPAFKADAWRDLLALADRLQQEGTRGDT